MKNIVITGASSGIGEALALRYAGEKCALFLTGRDEQRLEAVAAHCRDVGAVVVEAVVLDVRDELAMKAWLEALDARYPLDLVIANAGVSGGTGDVKGVEPSAQIKDLFDVNWQGVMNTVNPVLPLMVTRRRGQVALMSSLAGFRGFPGAPAYCASKAAVKVYGEGLRGTLRDTGVKVNVICPGFVESRMTAVNDYTMPFFMGAEKAAKIIVYGLARDKGRIAFPLPSLIFAWLFSALPDIIVPVHFKKSTF